jgi:beta-N-acetylhexosaminidase
VALAKAILGVVEPSGTLPVDVPADSGEVAYALGYGMHYA